MELIDKLFWSNLLFFIIVILINRSTSGYITPGIIHKWIDSEHWSGFIPTVYILGSYLSIVLYIIYNIWGY